MNFVVIFEIIIERTSFKQIRKHISFVNQFVNYNINNC